MKIASTMLCGLWIGLALPAWSTVTGQWDFNASNLTATVGTALQYRADTASQTQFGTTTSFGIANIGGQVAQVMKFPATTPTQGYIMPHGAASNGGGARVNRYTLIMDILFPTASTGFRALWQTETTSPTATDGDLFVNGAHGIGISGQYQGNLTSNVWHRVAFTVDLTTRELGKYIDGANVLSGPVGAPPLGANNVQYLDPAQGAGLDLRWSLASTALLFADEDNETKIGYVNSIQFHDRVLSAAEIAALGNPTAGGLPAPVAPGVAQWDFNGNLASSTGGSTLVSGAALPATVPGVSFTTPMINGQSAHVASFTRGTYFTMTHGFPANGGGTDVNQYTLIMDVTFPSRPTGWAVLWQTSPGNANDGDWFINPGGGVGISGNYGGSVPDGIWNRLALVVDLVGGTFTSFINGVQVQQLTGQAPDGRFSMETTGLLFADEDQENAAGFANSVQVRSDALTAADIAALGGPTAAGIPIPPPPSMAVTSPNGGENHQAGTTHTVAWVATNPAGLVQVDLYLGNAFERTLAQVPMRQTNYVWTIDPSQGNANNYRIRLTALTTAAVEDYSDGFFTVSGGGPPPNPLFGQALQANGGFESLLANWQTIQGSPTTLTTVFNGQGPHGGTRYFHGGINSAGDTTIRQVIDLIAAGFTASDLDNNAALNAEAWLRNFYGAGTFDDQVFYRVAYLDGSNQELASLRCMVAANSTWLQRLLSGLLPAGTRKLAIEITGKHRRDLNNDSMADDLIVKLQKPFPLPNPTITKLPMLQDVRQDAMTLLWETDGNLAHHLVDWGRTNVSENTLAQIETLQIDSTHFVHRATLTGLETETTYVYRVRSGSSSSATFSFRTAPHRDTPFAVAWWGDNHAGTVTLQQHISNMMAHGPDMIMVAGDIVNNGNVLSEWHDYWFKPLEHLNLAQTTPIIFARGNHDGEHALAYAYSKLPGNEGYFAFDYGNCRFIFLDSEASTSALPEQYDWLQSELARPETQRAAFRIACFHKPPFANLWNGGGYTGETFVRNDWVPLFVQGNVDIVISGHAHNYNRGTTNGVTYIVSGGGGGTLDTERVANWPHFTEENSFYHYDLMEVMDNMLTWTVYRNDNALLDLFTLKSRVPQLAWQSSVPVAGKLPLLVTGKPGTTYIIESSPILTTNAASWTPLVTNVFAVNGPSLRTNLVTFTPSQRFYRARVGP